MRLVCSTCGLDIPLHIHNGRVVGAVPESWKHVEAAETAGALPPVSGDLGVGGRAPSEDEDGSTVRDPRSLTSMESGLADETAGSATQGEDPAQENDHE